MSVQGREFMLNAFINKRIVQKGTGEWGAIVTPDALDRKLHADFNPFDKVDHLLSSF